MPGALHQRSSNGLTNLRRCNMKVALAALPVLCTPSQTWRTCHIVGFSRCAAMACQHHRQVFACFIVPCNYFSV